MAARHSQYRDYRRIISHSTCLAILLQLSSLAIPGAAAALTVYDPSSATVTQATATANYTGLVSSLFHKCAGYPLAEIFLATVFPVSRPMIRKPLMLLLLHPRR